MYYKLDPEEETKVLDFVLVCHEDIGDKEAAEEEEGVDREEALEDGLEGLGVLDLVEGPHGVVQVVEDKEEGVS